MFGGGVSVTRHRRRSRAASPSTCPPISTACCPSRNRPDHRRLAVGVEDALSNAPDVSRATAPACGLSAVLSIPRSVVGSPAAPGKFNLLRQYRHRPGDGHPGRRAAHCATSSRLTRPTDLDRLGGAFAGPACLRFSVSCETAADLASFKSWQQGLTPAARSSVRRAALDLPPV